MHAQLHLDMFIDNDDAPATFPSHARKPNLLKVLSKRAIGLFHILKGLSGTLHKHKMSFLLPPRRPFQHNMLFFSLAGPSPTHKHVSRDSLRPASSQQTPHASFVKFDQGMALKCFERPQKNI